MTEPDKIWPPAPSVGAKIAEGAAKFCPNCGRKLLTQTSALCNWCGEKINDPDYQQQAAANRMERDQAERVAVEAVMQEEAEFGVLGRLRRRAKQKNVGGGDLKP